MAKFVFSGDPSQKRGDPTKGGKLLGIEYEVGKPFEVENEAIAAKLRRHTHFTEVTGKGRKQPE